MIAIDTQEKFDWFLNAIENDELQLVSSNLTTEDREEIRREIAEYKAMHSKERVVKELVFA